MLGKYGRNWKGKVESIYDTLLYTCLKFSKNKRNMGIKLDKPEDSYKSMGHAFKINKSH